MSTRETPPIPSVLREFIAQRIDPEQTRQNKEMSDALCSELMKGRELHVVDDSIHTENITTALELRAEIPLLLQRINSQPERKLATPVTEQLLVYSGGEGLPYKIAVVEDGITLASLILVPVEKVKVQTEVPLPKETEAELFLQEHGQETIWKENELRMLLSNGYDFLLTKTNGEKKSLCSAEEFDAEIRQIEQDLQATDESLAFIRYWVLDQLNVAVFDTTTGERVHTLIVARLERFEKQIEGTVEEGAVHLTGRSARYLYDLIYFADTVTSLPDFPIDEPTKRALHRSQNSLRHAKGEKDSTFYPYAISLKRSADADILTINETAYIYHSSPNSENFGFEGDVPGWLPSVYSLLLEIDTVKPFLNQQFLAQIHAYISKQEDDRKQEEETQSIESAGQIEELPQEVESASEITPAKTHEEIPEVEKEPEVVKQPTWHQFSANSLKHAAHHLMISPDGQYALITKGAKDRTHQIERFVANYSSSLAKGEGGVYTQIIETEKGYEISLFEKKKVFTEKSGLRARITLANRRARRNNNPEFYAEIPGDDLLPPDQHLQIETISNEDLENLTSTINQIRTQKNSELQNVKGYAYAIIQKKFEQMWKVRRGANEDEEVAVTFSAIKEALNQQRDDAIAGDLSFWYIPEFLFDDTDHASKREKIKLLSALDDCFTEAIEKAVKQRQEELLVPEVRKAFVLSMSEKELEAVSDSVTTLIGKNPEVSKHILSLLTPQFVSDIVEIGLITQYELVSTQKPFETARILMGRIERLLFSVGQITEQNIETHATFKRYYGHNEDKFHTMLQQEIGERIPWSQLTIAPEIIAQILQKRNTAVSTIESLYEDDEEEIESLVLDLGDKLIASHIIQIASLIELHAELQTKLLSADKSLNGQRHELSLLIMTNVLKILLDRLTNLHLDSFRQTDETVLLFSKDINAYIYEAEVKQEDEDDDAAEEVEEESNDTEEEAFTW